MFALRRRPQATCTLAARRDFLCLLGWCPKDNREQMTRQLDEFTEETGERSLRSLAEASGEEAELLMEGARGALTGQSAGPSAFAAFAAIGWDRVVARLSEV